MRKTVLAALALAAMAAAFAADASGAFHSAAQRGQHVRIEVKGMRIRRVRRLILSTLIAALVASTGAFAAAHSTANFHAYVKSPVARGLQGHVVIQPGYAGLCRISVSKGGTQMRAKRVDRWRLGLYPKRSKDVNDYRVEWTWIVPPKTPLGLWNVRVNCGRAETLRKTFRVIRKLTG